MKLQIHSIRFDADEKLIDLIKKKRLKNKLTRKEHVLFAGALM